jgi:hypothetical protein
MTDDGPPDMSPMLAQLMQASMGALAAPETAELLATFSRNYFDALLKHGFSKADAMTLVSSHGSGLLRGGR